MIARYEMSRIAVLVSGGVDSAITYFLLKSKNGNDDIIPIFVNLGQSYWKKELAACKDLYGDQLVCLETNAPTSDDKDNSFIPNRNLFLASYATLAVYPDVIHISGMADDNRPDKTPKVFQEMSKILTKTSEKRITVTSDLWEYGKSDAVRMFLDAGIPNAETIMLKTLSCYSHVGQGHCNDCEACFRRWLAFAVNGIQCEPVSDAATEKYAEYARSGGAHITRINDMRQLGLLE